MILHAGCHIGPGVRPTEYAERLAEEHPHIKRQHDRSESLNLGVRSEDHLDRFATFSAAVDGGGVSVLIGGGSLIVPSGVA